MDKKRCYYRCSLCFCRVSNDGTKIGEKESHLYEIYTGITLPFCSEIHKDRYKALIECSNVYFKHVVLCSNKGCINKVGASSVNCLCGIGHKFCSTDCRDTLNKKIHRSLLPYTFSADELNKKGENDVYASSSSNIVSTSMSKTSLSISTSDLSVINTNCTTCFCGSIDRDSKCSSGHERCIMCEFRGKCRKCEAKTWYQRPLYYFYMDITWKQYENKVDISYIPECSICKRQQIEVISKDDDYYYIEKNSRLYLVQPCNHIVCINCSHKIDNLSCGSKHIQISHIFFHEIGNVLLWSLDK